jgi:uncharacterized RDD family membrane protein YckC
MNKRFNCKYPKAPSGKRFLASLLDRLITTVLSIPAIIAWANGMTELFNEYNENGAVPLFYLGGILLLIPLAYGLVKDGLGKGQSWGKKMLGLMVVYLPDNVPCSCGDSFVRNVVGAIPVIGWFVEPVMVLATADGRRLADKAANTQVVEKNMFTP